MLLQSEATQAMNSSMLLASKHLVALSHKAFHDFQHADLGVLPCLMQECSCMFVLYIAHSLGGMLSSSVIQHAMSLICTAFHMCYCKCPLS